MTQRERSKHARERYLLAVKLRGRGWTWSRIGGFLRCSGPRAFILHRKGLALIEQRLRSLAEAEQIKRVRRISKSALAAKAAEAELDRLVNRNASDEEIRLAAAKLDHCLGLDLPISSARTSAGRAR